MESYNFKRSVVGMPHFIVAASADASPQTENYKTQYYALRKKAFEASWNHSIYNAEPNAYDVNPDTRFVFMVEDGKVIAGSRLVIHTPGSNSKLPTEHSFPDFEMKKLMPHIDAHNMCYAEVGGAVVEPDERYRGRHLATEVLKKTFEISKEIRVDSDDKMHAIDFLIEYANEKAIGASVRPLQETGHVAWVRRDTLRTDERLNSHPVMILTSTNRGFPFTTPAMIENETIVPAAHYVSMIQR